MVRVNDLELGSRRGLTPLLCSEQAGLPALTLRSGLSSQGSDRSSQPPPNISWDTEPLRETQTAAEVTSLEPLTAPTLRT